MNLHNFASSFFSFSPWKKLLTLHNVILQTARNLLETKKNITIEPHPFYYIICDWFYWRSIKKKFLKKKIRNAHLSKCPFFKISNPQIFLSKISWIGTFVSRIDWCQRHWCSSTYMVMRLSDISSKTCIFLVFRLFLRLCRTASRPYRLSYINALCFNQSY